MPRFPHSLGPVGAHDGHNVGHTGTDDQLSKYMSVELCKRPRTRALSESKTKQEPSEIKTGNRKLISL